MPGPDCQNLSVKRLRLGQASRLMVAERGGWKRRLKARSAAALLPTCPALLAIHDAMA